MIGNVLNKEVAAVEHNYLKWLEISKLTELDFIKYRIIPNFEILQGNDNNYNIIVIGYYFKGKFNRIGEQFGVLENDLVAFEDLSLLLLLIAQKLDNANTAAPQFEQRPNYFYEKVKVFIERKEEYKQIKSLQLV